MALKSQTADPVYEDFVPPTEWAHEVGCDTLIVYLPGFSKDRLKVQVTSAGNLRVAGDRHLGDNKWRRFHQEFELPSNCDTNGITAKYEGGMLYVRHPKTIIPADQPQDKAKVHQEEPKPSAATSKPEKPTMETQQKKNGQDQTAKEPASKTMAKEPNSKLNEQENAKDVSEKMPKTEKETNDLNLKSSPAGDANNNVSQKSMEKTNFDEEVKEEKGRSNKEKHEDVADLGNNTATAYANGGRRMRLEGYKKIVGELVIELKKTRNMINLVLGVLLVVILFLYVKKTIKFIGEYEE